MKNVIVFTIVCFGITSIVNGQSLLKDSVMNAFVIQVNYQGHVPLGDMADRYGLNSSVGAAISFKLNRNFWLDFEGNYLFGKNIKEDDLFGSIKASNGNIIGTSGLFESINLLERGVTLKLNIGKTLPIGKPNVNSGILLKFGMGYMQHKIGISSRNEGALPHITDDYKKGYDRLAGGFMLSQFIGYLYMSNNEKINFYSGFEFNEGFTQGKRTWIFDERTGGEESRRDILISFKVGWLIPVYYKATKKYYYN